MKKKQQNNLKEKLPKNKVLVDGTVLEALPNAMFRVMLDNNSVVLSLYKENGKAYAVLDFAEDNQNAHLKLAAKYYNHKVLEIAATDMEKILEQL